MQTHAVISLYPDRAASDQPCPSRMRLCRLQTLAALVELVVTILIGLGVLVCFGLVFTML